MLGEIPLSVAGLLSLMITVLSGVVWRLYLENRKLYNRIDEIQTQRIEDAKETRDKIAEPLRQSAQFSELTYNKLVNGS